jgi:hypothetical protein
MLRLLLKKSFVSRVDRIMTAAQRYITSHIHGVQVWAAKNVMAKVIVELSTSRGFDYFEFHGRVYLDPDFAKELKEAVKKEIVGRLGDTKMRIKIMKRILARELRSTSGEIGALLPAVHPSTRKGSEEAGGGGAEARSEERGSGNEGASQGNV